MNILDITEHITKVKGGFELKSHKGKNLGKYPTKSGAVKREKQVNYFKHVNESVDLPKPNGSVDDVIKFLQTRKKVPGALAPIRQNPGNDEWHREQDEKEQRARDEKSSFEESQTENDTVDTVTVDVPLLIRIMEYAKEDAKTDLDLHNVAERLIKMGNEGRTLTMDDYDNMIGTVSEGGQGGINRCAPSNDVSYQNILDDVIDKWRGSSTNAN